MSLCYGLSLRNMLRDSFITPGIFQYKALTYRKEERKMKKEKWKMCYALILVNPREVLRRQL